MSNFQELHKHTENLKKNHRHEIGIERARHNDTKTQVAELKMKLDNVQGQLKVRLLPGVQTRMLKLYTDSFECPRRSCLTNQAESVS